MMLDAEVKSEFESWSRHPRGQLARILLCDQFPRSMYRGLPRSFAYDERARQLARNALDQGMESSCPLPAGRWSSVVLISRGICRHNARVASV